jgi:hypothetical protein
VCLNQFFSDHLPVLFDVYSGSLSLNPRTKVPCYKNANWHSFMSYLNQDLDLQDVSLSTIGGPPDIDIMVNHLTSCILEAKNIAVPNVVSYRYKLKPTEEISDFIRCRNQFRRLWGRNKNRELKKCVNKLTKEITLRVFALRGRKWGELLEPCRGNCEMSQNYLKIDSTHFRLSNQAEFRKVQSYYKFQSHLSIP